MNLQQLKYFITVAEELHFSRAAERLQMTQPPLSQQIKQLEQEMGVLLFYRSKRNVELTEAGKHFLNNAYKILNNLEEACEEALRIHLGKSGQLKIGFGPAYEILMWVLNEYKIQNPNVDMELRLLATTEQIKALSEGDIHVGIMPAPIEHKSIEYGVIREYPFLVALPKTHPLAKDTSPINIIDLAQELLIMTSRSIGPSYYDSIISLCHQAGFTPKISSQKVHELQTIVALVGSGMGIAILPESMRYFKKENVVFRQLKDHHKPLQLAIAWNKDNKSPVVKSFIETAQEIIKNQIE